LALTIFVFDRARHRVFTMRSEIGSHCSVGKPSAIQSANTSFSGILHSTRPVTMLCLRNTWLLRNSSMSSTVAVYSFQFGFRSFPSFFFVIILLYFVTQISQIPQISRIFFAQKELSHSARPLVACYRRNARIHGKICILKVQHIISGR